jgi:hypothetical protein
MSAFILRAPYPGVQTTTLLPAPRWGDSKALTASVLRMRAMDGTLYTYVRSKNGKKRLQWEFEISRNKALELREFFNSYHSALIQAIDHDGDSWVGYMLSNPFEFTGAGRAGPYWPGGETMTIRLELEER